MRVDRHGVVPATRMGGVDDEEAGQVGLVLGSWQREVGNGGGAETAPDGRPLDQPLIGVDGEQLPRDEAEFRCGCDDDRRSRQARGARYCSEVLAQDGG